MHRKLHAIGCVAGDFAAGVGIYNIEKGGKIMVRRVSILALALCLMLNVNALAVTHTGIF